MCEVGYQALSCFSMQWGTGWSLRNEAILQISNCAELVLRVVSQKEQEAYVSQLLC